MSEQLTNLNSLIIINENNDNEYNHDTRYKYPNSNDILYQLQNRFKLDLPFIKIGSSRLLSINPIKHLQSYNQQSQLDYKNNSYNLNKLILQPHPYEFSSRILLNLKRLKIDQTILFEGLCGSGKSFNKNLITNQLLYLSNQHNSQKTLNLINNFNALDTLLSSFGNSKTSNSPNASRHSNFFELDFNFNGKLLGAKSLVFGLDKSRLSHLNPDERSFHIFYQFLAGATPDLQDLYDLQDPSSYALLAKSGCFKLPYGPLSDDQAAFNSLYDAFLTLGFKQKHINSIWSLLFTILTLSNIEFQDSETNNVSASILTTDELNVASDLLGIDADELEVLLVNKSFYIRNDITTHLLDSNGASSQRDNLIKNLYAILFAYVVETANHRLAPPVEAPLHIFQLDTPGFNTTTPLQSTYRQSYPLINSYGVSNFNDFTNNYISELVHNYSISRTFDDNFGLNKLLIDDGIQLPKINNVPLNWESLLLLRGSPNVSHSQLQPGSPSGILGLVDNYNNKLSSGQLIENKLDDHFIQSLNSTFEKSSAFVFTPNTYGSSRNNQFTVNHYNGQCTYDASNFVQKDQDRMDPLMVSTLRSSSNSFVAKLFSGPSLSTKVHPTDNEIITEAQISSKPLRKLSKVTNSIDGIPNENNVNDSYEINTITSQIDATMFEIFKTIDKTQTWTVTSFRPNDSFSPNAIDKRRLKSQIETFLVPQVVEKLHADYIANYDFKSFCKRYISDEEVDNDHVAKSVSSTFLNEQENFNEGLDYKVGDGRIWLSYAAWKFLEDDIREEEEEEEDTENEYNISRNHNINEYHRPIVSRASSNFVPMNDDEYQGNYNQNHNNTGNFYAPIEETQTPSFTKREFLDEPETPGLEYNWKESSFDKLNDSEKSQSKSSFMANRHQEVQKAPRSLSRRLWVKLVWALTFYIPSFLLSTIGRMKRPDIRFAWREKLTLCILILLFCGLVLFYIIAFGRILCPRYNKAWSEGQLGSHADESDMWVAIQGTVYDITDFWRTQHSDIDSKPVTSDTMKQLAGQDLTEYFPPPLEWACEGLVSGSIPQNNQKQLEVPNADHTSGDAYSSAEDSALKSSNWYKDTFLPKMKDMKKGSMVIEKKQVEQDGFENSKNVVIYDGGVYDLSDYLKNADYYQSVPDSDVDFLDSSVSKLFKQNSGQDITDDLNNVLNGMDSTKADQHKKCLKRVYYQGDVDFRNTVRCQAQNYILLSFTIFLCCILLIKFLSALQLGSKRKPELQDKFIICQVPAYTEGEESLKKTIDSLAALEYDDKRKLILVICDGNIIGGGNDRTTPRIVLDIFGVDPTIDPEPLMFKSLGEGGKQMNYGKVYSGLYEYEGHVVPFMVVAKVGKPSERSRPGNRGKRDTQILVMRFLNRVHFNTPMYPLELEMCHQLRNIIGIEPSFYEYLFMIDADTSCTPEAVNRLVANCVDDSQIIGICGETRLDNEEDSWWTMIQVYEYFISHHLAKAFESLFGTVTCLPGCFSMYRIRTEDKGKPLIISTRVIEDYSENNVDTLHKKNLLSLGEDRYLTTIMLKHFSSFKMKFTADAIAHTAAPETWSILMSQRRRWINSTVHNFTELINLPDICGFLCFSMRFIVIIDLISTILLPATVVYLVYLIILVATGQGPFPIITIIMLGATYGFQITIFLLKREWQYVGWMLIYLISYPLWSFYLPLYSFWHFDDFGWGSTRIVIGEKGNAKIVATDEEPFHDDMIPLKTFSEYEAEVLGNSKGQFSDQPPMSSTISDFQFPPPHVMQRPFSSYSLATNNPYGPIQSQPPSRMSFNPYQVPSQSHMSFNPYSSMMMKDYQFPPQQSPQLQSRQSSYLQPTTPMGMGMQRPQSSYSLATNNVTNSQSFDNVATNPTSEPSDDQLLLTLRQYLGTTPLMQVTKRTAREYIQARFPNANIEDRKPYINRSIDDILEGKI